MLDNSGQINVEEIKADCTLTVGKNSRGTEAPLRKPKFTAPARTHLVLLLPRRQKPLEDVCAQPAQAVLLPRTARCSSGSSFLQTLPSPETQA